MSRASGPETAEPTGPAASEWTSSRKLAIYFLLVATGSGALFYAAAQAIPAAPEEQRTALVTAFHILYSLPAMLAAIGVQGALAGEPVLGPLGIRFRPNRGWAVALVLPLVLGGSHLALSLAIPGNALVTSAEAFAARLDELQRADISTALAAQARELGAFPAFALLAAALNPGGVLFQTLWVLPAELAWRGFVHHALGGGIWRTGFVTGALWGSWLVPLLALGGGFQEAPLRTAAVQIAAGLVLGPWLAFVRERSGSILATALCYAVLGRLGALPNLLVSHGSRWVVGFPGLALVVSAGLGLLVLRWATTRRADGRADEPAGPSEAPPGESTER